MPCEIVVGDALEVLRAMPDCSVDCCITSPPYWGLRDYGVGGQIGLEPTLQEFLARLVDVFAEVRRVLKKEGTCWVNMGDSYACAPNGRSAAKVKEIGNDDRTFRDKPFSTIGGTIKPKDLVGQPWRLAFALQDAGWYLRSDIIWHKPNPMPESVTDRPTKSHEYVFLLTKSQRYWYDADAIREPAETGVASYTGGAYSPPGQSAHSNARRKCGPNSRANVDRVPREHLKQDAIGKRTYTGFNDRYADPEDGKRNARTVWSIATKPFSEAHFATFPPELARRCILAGCPEGGTVLDPFGGAGTTGLVAQEFNRNAVLIELNPEYAEIARNRIQKADPLYSEVTVR